MQLAKGKPTARRCKECASIGRTHSLEAKEKISLSKKGRYIGANHPNWKGGRHKSAAGYVLVWVDPKDFFFSMARKGTTGHYVDEHRLIMAKHLNRCLLPWEVVHHKNGLRDDNRLENLELLPHGRFHLVDCKVKSYIKKLERENVRLRQLVEQAGESVT